MKNPGQYGEHNASERNKDFKLELVCKNQMDHNFNNLLVGKPFRYTNQCVISGGDDGTIRVYATKNDLNAWNFEEKSKLESKGGPVQCLLLHDVTKFGSIDLITGDSKGTLTIFSNEQILNRRILSQGCITALTVDVDFAGNLAIVVGDSEGGVTAVSPYGSLWKIRLQDAYKHMQKEVAQSLCVKCMVSVLLQPSGGVPVNYILVSDNCQNLLILQNGMVVYRLQTTSVVTAMTPGYFIPVIPPPFSPLQSYGSTRLQSPGRPTQVALGMEDGSIYVLNNFQLQHYVNVYLPITNLVSIPNDMCPDSADFLMCAGHFNALMVFEGQELVQRLETNEWIHTVSHTYDNNQRHIVLGMLDKSVLTYKVMS